MPKWCGILTAHQSLPNASFKELASELFSTFVSKRVNQELNKGKREAIERVNRTLIRSSVDIAINLIILLTAIFGSRYWFTQDESTLIITGLYLASVLYGLLRFLLNAREILGFIYYLIKYRQKAFHCWVADKIAPYVHSAYDELHLVQKLVVAFGPGPSRAEYIEMQTSLIVKSTAIQAGLLVGIFLLYVGVFRFIVAPILIEDVTGLSLLQAFLWPFALAVDYYWGTHWADFVEQANHL